jgi:hypothetical protein
MDADRVKVETTGCGAGGDVKAVGGKFNGGGVHDGIFEVDVPLRSPNKDEDLLVECRSLLGIRSCWGSHLSLLFCGFGISVGDSRLFIKAS